MRPGCCLSTLGAGGALGSERKADDAGGAAAAPLPFAGGGEKDGGAGFLRPGRWRSTRGGGGAAEASERKVEAAGCEGRAEMLMLWLRGFGVGTEAVFGGADGGAGSRGVKGAVKVRGSDDRDTNLGS